MLVNCLHVPLPDYVATGHPEPSLFEIKEMGMGPAVLLGIVLLALGAVIFVVTLAVSGLVRLWKYLLRVTIFHMLAG